MKPKTRRVSRKSLREKLDVQLDQLETAQLVHRDAVGEPTYTFKNVLTQEAAYASLLHQHQRELHRRVAETYEHFYPDRLDDIAAVLAQHYADAGDDAKTLEFSIRAGDAAMRVYASAEAVVHYTRALEVAKIGRPEGEEGASLRAIYLKRGRALELLSHFDEASRNYDEMYALARERGNRAFELAALIAAATIRAIPGSARDETQGRAFASQALALAHELGDLAAEAKALWILMLLNVYADVDAPQAIAFGEQSLAIARELNLREQMAYTLHDLMPAYAYIGELDRARTVRLQAREIWRELDNKPMLAESISGLALLHFMLGEFDQALSMAQEGFQIGVTISNLGTQGFSGYVLGLNYYELGEFTQAIKSIEEAFPVTQFGGLEGNGLSPHGTLAAIYADLGNPSRALEYIRLALGRSSAEHSLQRMWLYALLTRVELIRGNLGAAETAFREGGVIVTVDNATRMFPPAAPMIYFAAIELALARHEDLRVLELSDAWIEHLRAIHSRFAMPEALYLKAQALRGKKKFDLARDVLNEAWAEANSISARRMVWRILVALGEIEAHNGNTAKVRSLNEQAREAIEYIAAHAPEDLRASFLALLHVRAVMNTEDHLVGTLGQLPKASTSDAG